MRLFTNLFVRRLVFTVLLFFFGISSASAQENTPQQKIINSLKDYFLLERENIHIHLDKTTFLTNETIWFKGYVFNRKKNIPYLITTNVYAVLIDANGKKLSEKLLFSNNGTFSGNFKLDPSFASGMYNIQLYTNWMNNFSEDESSTFAITIINEKQSVFFNYENTDYTNPKITFHPEGGNFIEGVSNSIGVKISDCFGNPIIAQEAQIINAKGEVIRNFNINNFGLGRFELRPDFQNYKAVFLINGKKTEAQLPMVKSNGIAFEANNYAISNKTIVKIRTNSRSMSSYAGKTFFLVVQQDEKSTIMEINFNNGKPEQELVFSSDVLFDGTNTLRLIDSDLNQLAERMVFKYPNNKPEMTILPTASNPSKIAFTGTLNHPNANLSISVLPENSIANNNRYDIFGSFLLNPYVSEKIFYANYYFTNRNKARHYEIDLALLNQNSGKYNWNDILTNPPKKNFDFDIGLTLKGKVNQTISDKSKYKIRMLVPQSQLDIYTELDEKNEFYFKNLVVADSSFADFTLVKNVDMERALPLNVLTNIINGRRTFKNPFQPNPNGCKMLPNDSLTNDYPEFQGKIVQLDNVEIDSKFKLKRQSQFGNSNLRGYKITAENNNLGIVNFIQQNGFETMRDRGQVTIYGRSITTINGMRNTPAVFLDNRQLMSFEELWDLKMEDIDEVYINAHAIVPGMNNYIGIIKIYRKKMSLYEENPKSNIKATTITNGFKRMTRFKNASYDNTTDSGFVNFGLLYWLPTVLGEENGEFKFQINTPYQNKVRFHVEGFTPEGHLVSEIKTVISQ